MFSHVFGKFSMPTGAALKPASWMRSPVVIIVGCMLCALLSPLLFACGVALTFVLGGLVAVFGPIISVAVIGGGVVYGVLVVSGRVYRFFVFRTYRPVDGFTSVRSKFKRAALPDPVVPIGNTHPTAASLRNATKPFVEALSSDLGLTPYYKAMANMEQHQGKEGDRKIRWTKDAITEHKPQSIDPGRHLIAMIDCDYYKNMPNFLWKWDCPVITYTVNPSAASATETDYSFRFLEDGRLDYRVVGGGWYNHHVWDYNHDSLLVRTRDWFGGEYVRCVHVDRRSVDRHHDLVLLTPVLSCYVPVPMLAEVFARVSRFVEKTLSGFGFSVPVARLFPDLQGKSLVRIDPIVRGESGEAFVRLHITTADGPVISTAACAAPDLCITIPSAVDDAVYLGCRNSQMATAASVTYFLKDGYMEDNGWPAYCTDLTRANVSNHAAPLVNFINALIRPDLGAVVFATPVPGAYRFFGRCLETPNEAKPCMRPLMNPLMAGGFHQLKTETNLMYSITDRVIRYQVGDLSKDVAETDEELGWNRDFFSAICPPNSASLAELPEVAERQPRPTQRKLFAEANALGSVPDAPTVKTFSKSEVYGLKSTDLQIDEPTVKIGRMITPDGPVNKVSYSRVNYAIQLLLKTCDWYCIGMTPRQIAQRVVVVCRACQGFINLSDFSRMDGHVKPVARRAFRAFLRHAFIESDVEFVLACYDKQMNRAAKASVHETNHMISVALRYSTAATQMSGGSDTSNSNTFLDALIAYRANRASGLDHEEAWAKLGFYVGDDGGSPDLNPEVHTKQAARLGQELKTSTVPVGEIGVNFLNRYFGPGVWFDDLTSMSDTTRALQKLHLTVGVPPSVEQRLFEVCYSYFLTDANTPWLGKFVSQYVLLYSREHPDRVPAKTTRFWDQFDFLEQWPNQIAPSVMGWPKEYARGWAPFFDGRAFEEWVGSAKNYRELMTCPGFDRDFIPEVPAFADLEGLPLFPERDYDLILENYWDVNGQCRVQTTFKKKEPKVIDAPVKSESRRDKQRSARSTKYAQERASSKAEGKHKDAPEKKIRPQKKDKVKE